MSHLFIHEVKYVAKNMHYVSSIAKRKREKEREKKREKNREKEKRRSFIDLFYYNIKI